MVRRRRRSGATTASKKQSGPSGQLVAEPASPRLELTHLAIGAAVAAVAGVLYYLTAARDIVLGDTPELVTAAITLGVPHAPGYPLVTMLGHLFSLLPIGSLPFRVDLLAVACGTATVAIVYLTALRLSRNCAASACAALVLALSPLFWSWSLVAEVFSLNNLLAAVFIFLLVIWHQQPERLGLLAGGAFVSGLALTNQQTIVLLGPAVLFLLWNHRKQILARPSMLAATVAALLAGLLPYAYLPWAAARHPLMNFGDASTFSSFLALVTRKHFGTGQLINAPKYMGGSPLNRIWALGASFTVLAALLSLLGAAQAYRRRRWYFWFSILAFTFSGPVFVAYANINLSVPLTRFVLERFYLLSHVVLAPLMAFGVMQAADLLTSLAPASWGRRLHSRRVGFLNDQATALVCIVVLPAALGSVLANYAAIDQSKNHVTRRFAEDILATLEPNSILVLNGDEVINPLTYLQDVEGYRPDVALIIMPFLPTDWYLTQLQRQYPNLVVPFASFDGQNGTLKALIEANPRRPAATVGIDSDDSLKGSYWFYRRGLISAVEPMSRDVKLDELIADNQQLLARYRPPSPSDIKPTSLELTILTHYAIPAIVVAGQCEELRYYPEARTWYERALSLDPSLSEINTALARLPKAQ